MPTLEEFQKWVGEKPDTRVVKIDIKQNTITFFVMDMASHAYQTVTSVAEIDLEGIQAQKEKAELERLRAKYEGQGNG